MTYTQDLSRGGLFIRTDQFLPIGSVIQVNLELPDDGPPETALARVAYTLGPEEAAERGRNPGMGMELVDLPQSLAERIARQVTRHVGGSSEPAEAEPGRVLVVDDSEIYRKQLVQIVEALGHVAETAENGLEAMGKLMRDPPDLVLSDVNMPVMDGWQFLRIVRSRASVAHVPVIFLTELSGEEERLRGYRLGVDDYLAKPFGQEELELRITRSLSRSRNRPSSSADRGVLRGDLALVSLPSVLAFLEAERRTGFLLVVSEPQIATLHIRQGQVVRVDFADDAAGLEGVDRLLHVLDWNAGWFELGPGEVDCEPQIELTVSQALLEHARRADEASRDG